MNHDCNYEPPKPPAPCCCGEPISYTIQIGDEPPTFHVNTDLLESLGSQRGPSSVSQVQAQWKQGQREME